jgi:hypothetical protein
MVLALQVEMVALELPRLFLALQYHTLEVVAVRLLLGRSL